MADFMKGLLAFFSQLAKLTAQLLSTRRRQADR